MSRLVRALHRRKRGRMNTMSNMGIRGANRRDVGGDVGEGLTGLISVHLFHAGRWLGVGTVSRARRHRRAA